MAGGGGSSPAAGTAWQPIALSWVLLLLRISTVEGSGMHLSAVVKDPRSPCPHRGLALAPLVSSKISASASPLGEAWQRLLGCADAELAAHADAFVCCCITASPATASPATAFCVCLLALLPPTRSVPVLGCRKLERLH